jgi:hypothetical protein
MAEQSDPLQFEIVVKPNPEVAVKVTPQKPGSYGSFDHVHREAKGMLLMQ